MAVGFYAEIQMSTEQAETILRDLGEKAPDGLIVHAEGPIESGGTWVMDCWESPEKMQAFFEQKLVPIMQKMGVTPPQANTLPVRIVLTQDELRRL